MNEPTNIGISYSHPEYVDWRISYKCNQRCPFCYGPERTNTLNTGQALKVIDVLDHLSVKGVTITGGEPLLRNDLPIVLRALKKYEIMTYLSTNGDFFMDRHRKIVKYLDAMALPIEDHTHDIHDRIRVMGNFGRVTRILEYFSNVKSHLIIDIGTVVSSKNVGRLSSIEKLLTAYHVRRWRVYQFLPYKDRKLQERWYKRNLHISGDQFERGVSDLGKYLSRNRIHISNMLNRNRAYFMINPNGNVVVPSYTGETYKDVYIGHILQDDINDLVSRWNDIISFGNYSENAIRKFY